MEQSDMKKCPYCAEMIKAEAIKCRYCGSLLAKKVSTAPGEVGNGYWRRIAEGKKIAGVCTGLARQFEAPVLVLPLRVFFVVTTLFYAFGLILYVVLWLLMPPPVDKPSAAGSTEAPPQSYAPPSGSYAHAAAPTVERYPGHSGTAGPSASMPGKKEPEKSADSAVKESNAENGSPIDLGADKEDKTGESF